MTTIERAAKAADENTPTGKTGEYDYTDWMREALRHLAANPSYGMVEAMTKVKFIGKSHFEHEKESLNAALMAAVEEK